jgi:hypothetical protein
MPLSRMGPGVGYGLSPLPEEDHAPVDVDDRFSALLEVIEGAEQPGGALTDLAQRYAHVVPDDRSLAVLASLGPLVELGAGTGYWAYRLRALSVDVIAIDQMPPGGERRNRYHDASPPWTEVIAGDQTVLTEYSERSLLLCWPPLFSSLGDCLTYYSGTTVALIGDGGHRTARLAGLNDAFSPITVLPVRAVEPFPGAAPTLSVWQRRPDR